MYISPAEKHTNIKVRLISEIIALCGLLKIYIRNYKIYNSFKCSCNSLLTHYLLLGDRFLPISNGFRSVPKIRSEEENKHK